MCVARNYTLAFFSARGRPYLRIQSQEYAPAPLETLSRLAPISFEPSPFPVETSFFATPRRRQPELFPSPATTTKERYIYIPVAPDRETSGAPTRRGNTEYHRQTLISFCRGQIVPSRSNFRGSSHALNRASSRRARIRADVVMLARVSTFYIDVAQER